MNKAIIKKAVFIGLVLGILGMVFLPSAGAGNVPTMTKEELKGMLENSDVAVLDVRIGKDWDASEFKIQGADRTNPKKFKDWREKYPKDKTLVLYCA